MKKLFVISILLIPIFGESLRSQTLQPQTPQPPTLVPGSNGTDKTPAAVPRPPQLMTPQMPAVPGMPGGGYTDTSIHGWKIKINSKLSEGHRLMTEKALQTLSNELAAL